CGVHQRKSVGFLAGVAPGHVTCPQLGGCDRLGPPADQRVQETRQQFSVNKARAIALLQKAINALEEEIGDAQSEAGLPQKSEAAPVVASDDTSELRTPPTRTSSGFVGNLRRHVGRWWRGRSR